MRPFGWMLSWFLYYMGDLSCKFVLDKKEESKWDNFWLWVYQKSMSGSCGVQDWFKGEERWPWQKPKEKQNDC